MVFLELLSFLFRIKTMTDLRKVLAVLLRYLQKERRVVVVLLNSCLTDRCRVGQSSL